MIGTGTAIILRAWRFMLMCPLLLACGTDGGADLTAKEAFGKRLFFDRNLSLKGNQSCSSCHLLEAGWSGDDSAINAHGAAYEGSVAGRFGNRRPPTAAYATPSPVLHAVKENGDTVRMEIPCSSAAISGTDVPPVNGLAMLPRIRPKPRFSILSSRRFPTAPV